MKAMCDHAERLNALTRGDFCQEDDFRLLQALEAVGNAVKMCACATGRLAIIAFGSGFRSVHLSWVWRFDRQGCALNVGFVSVGDVSWRFFPVPLHGAALVEAYVGGALKKLSPF